MIHFCHKRHEGTRITKGKNSNLESIGETLCHCDLAAINKIIIVSISISFVKVANNKGSLLYRLVSTLVKQKVRILEC